MSRHAVVLWCALAVAASGAVRAHAQVAPPGPTLVDRATSPLQPGPAQVTLPPPTETLVPRATTPTAASPGAPTAGPSPSAPSPGVPTGAPTAALPVDLDRPILRVVDTHVDPAPVAPGGELTVRIDVQNVGRRDAEHVQLTLGGAVFLPLDRGAVLYKEEIDAAETRPFEARLRADSAAQSGVYPLSLALRWEDAEGGSYGEQTSLGIQVVASARTRPVIVVTSSQVPSRCVPGVPFSIVLTLANGGGTDARNVVVVPAAGPLALAGGDQPPVGLAPGASATVSLRVQAAETVEPGAAAQTLELRYDDPDGQRYTDNTVIGISVAGDAVLGPRPMVTGYSVGTRGDAADVLNPGQTFELVLEVQNVGARDALATRLALGGGTSSAGGTTTGSATSLGAFAPLGTSNVRFLGRLAAGATETIRQRMIVDGSAKPGVYVLEVAFSYTDADGEPASSSEVVSLLVARRTSLEINPVSVVTRTIVGEEVPFAVELVNAGDATVDLGNAEVTAEAGVEVVDGTVFIGPVDAGALFPIDATLIGRTPGVTQLKITAHYTDDFGQAQTYEETFELTVEPAPERPADTDVRATRRQRGLAARVLLGLLGLGASPGYDVPESSSIGEPVIIESGTGSGAVRIERAAPAEAKPAR